MMTQAGRMRLLVAAVVIAAALMVVVSRQLGRLMGEEGAAARRVERSEGGDEAAKGATVEERTTAELMFWKLNGTRGDRGGLLDSDSRIRAPEETPKTGGAFVVQVLATHDAKRARRLKDKLRALGMPAVVSQGAGESGPIYRVRVGRYSERRTAVAWAEKIRAQEGLTPWVIQEAD